MSTYVINIYSFKCFKLNADKLKSAPGDLKKVSDVIEKEAVKKNVFAELVKNVNAIDTSKLVNKTDYNATVRPIKIEDKIPSITNLATTATLNAAENKIPNFSDKSKIIMMQKYQTLKKIFFITSD